MKKLLAPVLFALMLLAASSMFVRSASANGFWAKSLPQDAFDTLVTLSNNGHSIKSVAVAPNGGWVIFYDRNGYQAKNIPGFAFDKIVEASNAGYELKAFSFAPNGAWAFTFGFN